MATSQECLKKYGEPSATNPCMTLWDVPPNLEIGHIPKKIFCNKDMVIPLTIAFGFLISRECYEEIITFDGCFNIRKQRGATVMSLHSWGNALDLNAFANPLGWTYEQAFAKGLKPFTDKFLQCFRDAGMICGGDFIHRKDRMHFEIGKI